MQEEGKAEYDRLVNTYRNRLANPSAGLGDVAPEGSTSNPFYNPTYTNAITGPGGIEVRTKPADEITGSADVEGGLQMYGRTLWDRLFGGSPSMDSGGSIIGSGALIGHGGEQIDNASVVADGDTTLSRINKMVASGGQGDAGTGISASAHITVNIGTVSKDVDIDRLIDRIGNEGADRLVFALRSRLDSTSSRGIAYLRG